VDQVAVMPDTQDHHKDTQDQELQEPQVKEVPED
jgi:hypothetical protein